MTSSTIDETDRHLLERFVAQADEEAFARLVHRHGAMVLGVCRQILRREADAEDAFQATFLVLARKAGSIRAAEALPNWLYNVARRVALRSKWTAARRQAHEVALVEPPPNQPAPERHLDDLASALHEEIGRLPDRYRIPLVLCYLDGKTNEEAARQLGCPSGTVFSRLARARERLRTRLQRRGLVLSSTLLLAALSSLTELARTAAPAELAFTAIRRALRFGPRKAADAKDLPADIRELAEWGIHSPSHRALQITVSMLAITALGGGLYLGLHAFRGPEQTVHETTIALKANVEQAIARRLQGHWKIKSMSVDGNPAPAFLMQIQLTLINDKITLGQATGIFEINTQKNPMQIDWVCPNGTTHGIFELHDDTLKICVAVQSRPSDFRPAFGNSIMVFERKPSS